MSLRSLLCLSKLFILLLVLFLETDVEGVTYPPNRYIKTYAGTGTTAYNGNYLAATSTNVGSPTGLWQDTNGNLYIASSAQSIIRVVTPGGKNTSTFAGIRTAGADGDGGLATTACLNSPYGIWGDSNGMMYFADLGNSRIRKINMTTGIIDLVAGSVAVGRGGFTSHAEVTASNSLLNSPTALAFYPPRNSLLSIDSANNRLVEIYSSPTSPTTTMMRTWLSGAGSLGGVFADTAGNVFVSIFTTNEIRKYNYTTKSWIIIAGNGGVGMSGDGPDATLRSLNSPAAIVGTKNGSLYVADRGNYQVRILVPHGDASTNTYSITSVMGTSNGDIDYPFGTREASTIGIGEPDSLALDQYENLYVSVADPASMIIKYNVTTKQLELIAGVFSVDSGYNGDHIPASAALLNYPSGLWFDTVAHALYIADVQNNRIRLINMYTGNISTVVGDGAAYMCNVGTVATACSINKPVGILGDAFGNIYFTEHSNHRIRKITNTTTKLVVNIAGMGEVGVNGFNGDNLPATSTRLSAPQSVVGDTLGQLYFVDSGNFRIRMITSQNKVVTLVGNGTIGLVGEYIDALQAKITPNNLWLDSAGSNIYFCDSGHKIFQYELFTTMLRRLTGKGYGGFYGDDMLASDGLVNSPIGLWGNTLNELYFGDGSNFRVRKIDLVSKIMTSVTNNIIGPLSGTQGDNGAASAAYLGSVTQFGFNSKGDLILGESSFNRVRRVYYNTTNEAYFIERLAGGGMIIPGGGQSVAATSASVGNLAGLWVAPNDDIYISDSTYHVIRRIDVSTSMMTVIAGKVSASGYNFDDRFAELSMLKQPNGLCGTSDYRIFIADSFNYRIRKLVPRTSSKYNISTIAGTGTSGRSTEYAAATSSRIGYIRGVACDDDYNVWLTDSNYHVVHLINGTTKQISTVVGMKGSGGYNGDNLPGLLTRLISPCGVWVDSAGNVFVADTSNNLIRKWSVSTNLTTIIAGTGVVAVSDTPVNAKEANLNTPGFVMGDKYGNIFIADSSNFRIRKIDNVTGILSTFAGSGFKGLIGTSTENLPIADSRISATYGIFGDRFSNSIYTTERISSRIRVMYDLANPTSQPSSQPSIQPSNYPSAHPSSMPSAQPFLRPSYQPTVQPTGQPSCQPSGRPSTQPQSAPSNQPSSQPSSEPSRQPNSTPSSHPSNPPSGKPTTQPQSKPSRQPSSQPSRQPSISPTTMPISEPTFQPSNQPTNAPTTQPSIKPTSCPSSQPLARPSSKPTSCPSIRPTNNPTAQPSAQPFNQPSLAPMSCPTSVPSSPPSLQPSSHPSIVPSALPTTIPSMHPFASPTLVPSKCPSSFPTGNPVQIIDESDLPSFSPTRTPSFPPSQQPSTMQPSSQPTALPSAQPFGRPTSEPTFQPVAQPSSQQPSLLPSSSPSSQPLAAPTSRPSDPPVSLPTQVPKAAPTSQPTLHPTSWPSAQPTRQSSSQPSTQPLMNPTSYPSTQPTLQPSLQPVAYPSSQPSKQPMGRPSSQPSRQPSRQPTTQPNLWPTGQPTTQPTSNPTAFDRFNPEVVNKLLSSLLQASTNFSASNPASVQAFVDDLVETILDLRLIGNTTQMRSFQFTVGSTQFVLALFAPQGDNSTSIKFFPTLSIPGTPGSIDIANMNSQGGSALAAVINHNSYASIVNASSKNSTEFLSNLRSDVVNVRVEYLNRSSTPQLPAFVANISVFPERKNASAMLSPTFLHNCSVGTREVILFHCLGANVMMNLTCSGEAAAVVRRQCPVSRTVCNVVNMKTLQAEADNEYCVASSISSSFVVCRCGLDRDRGRNTTQGTGPDALQSSVSVAVMSKYFAGDFSSTISVSSSVGSGDIAKKSAAIYIVFGCLWGIGVLFIGLQFYSKDGKEAENGDDKLAMMRRRRHKVGLEMQLLEEGVQQRCSELEMKADTRRKFHLYLVEVLPNVFQPKHWWPRLQEEFMKGHTAMSVLLAMTGYSWHHTDAQNKSKLAHRSSLEIARFLSSITMSFFLLAYLYDFQYANDDGSCNSHVNSQSCMERKSPLDPSQAYCSWVPFVNATAGVLLEMKNGAVLQRIALSSTKAVGEDATATSSDHCMYAEAVQSSQAFIVLAVVTSCFSLLVMHVFTFLFNVIGARSKEEEASKEVAKELQMKASTGLMSVVPIGENPLRGDVRGNRRAAVGSVQTIPHQEHQPDADEEALRSRFSISHVLLVTVDKLFQLQLDTTTAIVAAPFALQRARRNLLLAFDASFPGVHQQQKPRISDRRGVVAISSTWQQKAQLLRRKANDVEFGASVLHAMLTEMLGEGSNQAKLFQNTVWKDFMEELPPVASHWQWAALVLVVLCNAGSLFFIVLKGIQRGSAWQQSYLYACLLQVVLDILVFESIEVLWIDFCLPGFIFRDVVEKGLFRLQLLADDFLAKQRQSSVGSNQTQIDLVGPRSALSTTLAAEQVQLLESQIALQQSNPNSRTNNTLAPAPTQPATSNIFSLFAAMPLGLQRFCIRLATPIAFGGISLAWVSLLQLENGQVYISMVVLFLAMMPLALVASSVSHQQLTPPITLLAKSDEELFAVDDKPASFSDCVSAPACSVLPNTSNKVMQPQLLQNNVEPSESSRSSEDSKGGEEQEVGRVIQIGSMTSSSSCSSESSIRRKCSSSSQSEDFEDISYSMNDSGRLSKATSEFELSPMGSDELSDELVDSDEEFDFII